MKQQRKFEYLHTLWLGKLTGQKSLDVIYKFPPNSSWISIFFKCAKKENSKKEESLAHL